MKRIKLKGTFNYLNNGSMGYVIPENVIRQEMKEFNKKIKTNGFVIGMLNCPDTPNIVSGNVSHKIYDVEMDKDGLGFNVDMEILETPNGKELQKLLSVEKFKPEMKFNVRNIVNDNGDDELKLDITTFNIIKK